MAQKVQTFLIDDLDGSDAEGTVLFGLDGEQYEIDLSTESTPRNCGRPWPAISTPAGRLPARPGGQARTGARPPRAASATPRYAPGPKHKGLRSKSAAGSQLTSSPGTGRLQATSGTVSPGTLRPLAAGPGDTCRRGTGTGPAGGFLCCFATTGRRAHGEPRRTRVHRMGRRAGRLPGLILPAGLQTRQARLPGPDYRSWSRGYSLTCGRG